MKTNSRSGFHEISLWRLPTQNVLILCLLTLSLLSLSLNSTNHQDSSTIITMAESSKENRVSGGSIAPFLAKCYDMVDDESTNSTISWSPNNNSSFVIWDVIHLQTELLPKYFKHSNFSSFMRQLNTYGFRKSDPDRWEFVNDGFIKGQKHLLRNISRRKPTQSLVQEKHSQKKNISVGTVAHQRQNTSVGTLVQQKHPQHKNTSVRARTEARKFSPWEEVENLNKDKNVLMQELVNLNQHQQSADNKLHHLKQRLKGMELNQQQMLSLLAMAMQSPGFLGQLLQQNESNWCISEKSNKVSLPVLQHGIHEGRPLASERRIVRYQPHKSDIPKPSIVPNSNMDEAEQLDSSNELEDLFMNIDVMSFADGISTSMEDDAFIKNDGSFVFPELPEDVILDKLHLAYPLLENGEKVEHPKIVKNVVDHKSTTYDTSVESSPVLGL